MNLNQIHEGEDYAEFDFRGRGENYRRSGVKRIKVIRTYSQREYGNTKDTGYAEGFLLDNETGEFRLNTEDQPRIIRVRARDVVCSWEEYADEHDRREVIRLKQEEEWRIRHEKMLREREEREERERIEREERLEKERIAAERRAQEKQRREAKIYAALKERYNIEKVDGLISIALGELTVTVYINRSGLERELGLDGGSNNNTNEGIDRIAG